MTDIFSESKRSDIMSKITGRETKPEVLVRKYLFSKGFRFRKNVKELPGKPDIVLSKYKMVIFIHGCFWHGHPGCKKAKLPATNVDFWKKKINENTERDKKNIDSLKLLGWNVEIIWQCELRNRRLSTDTLDILVSKLRNG